MTEGTSTFEGLAVTLSGESEIKATTAALDILTLTGASSHTGEYVVGQTSDGVEEIAIRGLSSSGDAAGIKLSGTSTGAIAAGASKCTGVLVQSSSKSNMTAAFAYQNYYASGTSVGVTDYLLACHGSKAPTYFLGIGATATGDTTATDNGFVDAGLFLTAAIATTTPMVGLKVQFGDSVFYVMCIAQCGLSA